MNIIDADKLIAEIERLEKQLISGACAAQINMETSCKEEAYKAVKNAITSLQQEQPMPDSTQLIELWHKDEEMLKEKDFRNDQWRLAFNAFMCGFGRGIAVKMQEQPSEDLEKEIGSSLNEAAQKVEDYYDVGEEHGYLCCHRGNIKDAFKAGAEWQKNKMLEDAVDATVSETTRIIPGCGSYTGAFQCKEIHIKVSEEFKKGEKVKVLIIKKNRI